MSGLAKLFTGMMYLPRKVLLGTAPASLKKETMVLSNCELDILPSVLHFCTLVHRWKSRALRSDFLAGSKVSSAELSFETTCIKSDPLMIIM